MKTIELIQQSEAVGFPCKKWYVCRTIGEETTYLWPDGKWRLRAYKNDQMHAYYETKELAIAMRDCWKQ